MSDLTEVESADAYCRLLTRRHYENFIVASGLLRGRPRLDLQRIYAFCRTTDDLGDESGPAGASRLERWRSCVGEFFSGTRPVHPVLIALHETVQRCGIPAQPFLDLIEANAQDQTVTSYETWPDLRAYCLLSAAPVGRMVLRVFDMWSLPAELLSDDVCIGLQLANHAQDVRRDKAKGRTYLLQSDLRSAGTVGAVRSLCERARELLSSGRQLEAMAPGALRFQLALYRLGGLAILNAIERIGYRTDASRPRVSKAAHVLLAGRALLGSTQGSERARRFETV